MRWRDAAMASSAGRAKSGVPAKATASERSTAAGPSDRGCAGGRGFPAFGAQTLFFLDFLAHALALHLRQVIDEQAAVEVIDLVLHADREQSFEIALERLAVAAQRAHADARGAFHFVVIAGHRQAALLRDFL